VASEFSRADVREEENLLIEAVSLLVQRQRETESWVAGQVLQADERAAASERRYAELETRLGGIEDQLNRLMRDVEPGRADSAVDERLARLREQLEGLRAGSDGRPVRATGAAPTLATLEAVPPPPHEPEPTATKDAARPRAAGTAQDRFGIALIGLGAVAVVYAILSQLPLR
jgi:hypothetical protein